MQRTSLISEGDGLFERIRVNRLLLQEGIDRLSAARAVIEERRIETIRLLGQARDAIALLRRNRAGAEPARTVRPAAVPRYAVTPPAALDAERQRLHEAYAASGDPAIRAELLQSYDGFARSLALRYRHREPLDDLLQVARIGLLHAIDRFDPALGRPFPLFARITITGELKRHIRDRTWGMRVPRSLQEDYLNVMRAVDELTAEHSDSPSMEALAARCGMSVERVVEALELRVSQRALSIDAPANLNSDDPVIELGEEDIGFRQLENRQFLANLLGRLPERDRRIIELRFIDELTQSEIAAQVGVSQMCVSRVLARTLGRLRVWARAAVS
jgi:RNA polymerase sigma-B factor